MPKFQVPLIVEVECKSLEEARAKTYLLLKDKIFEGLTVELANDAFKDRDNNRVVFLHPEDTDAGFDEEEYISQLTERNGK